MEQRLFRLLCALLAAFAAANGARMALDPLGWFASMPELALTGAANPHFIRDVGTAYLASAAGLALAAFRPAAGFGALLVAAIFMAGHGIGHLLDIAGGCAARPGGTALDWFGVIVPGAITAALCLWSLRFRPS
ncbi:MAG: hypothetical protein KF895_11920 [Parvibaculum sp.]|nr:hypothetical protein [Parvibaculum sp.]